MSVAVFGVIWFAFATLLTLAVLLGSPTVQESAPAYLFAASTIGLAVVLYLGYASFVILGLVCILCVVTYAAVIALFLISGAATSIPMTTVPRRAVGDLKGLRHSPLAMALAALFLVGDSLRARVLPARGVVDRRRRRAIVRARRPRATADRAGAPCRVRALLRGPAAVALDVPGRGREGADRQVQRLPVPGVRRVVSCLQDVLAKYEASNPGAVRLVTQDFPLEPECNYRRGRTRRRARLRWRSGWHGAKGRGDALEEWLFANQQGMTADSVKQAARDVGQVTDFDARYQATLEQVKADIALRPPAGRAVRRPTFFINGVKIDGMLPPRFTSIKRSRTSCRAARNRPGQIVTRMPAAGHLRSHQGLSQSASGASGPTARSIA